MKRESIFATLKKISNAALVLLVILIVIERIIYPLEDLANIIRILLITVFIFTALPLPWVKGANYLFKTLSLIGITIYILGLLLPNFNFLAAVAILLGVFMLLFSDSWGYVKDENNQNEDEEKGASEDENDDEDNEPFPQPEPAARAGKTKTLAKYYISTILMLLNPFQLWQMVCHTLGNISLSELAEFKQKGTYTLPFAEEWLVVNGGIEQEDSHSWDIINQRYAYDFVVADSQNRRHKNNGDNLQDYYCYGKNILSPGDGKVIKIKDGVRDYPHPGTMALDFLAKDFRGNFVIIKHEEKEYSFMAHFIPGSFKVKEGEFVTRGQVIGKCGNSGHSTEPHLHFHIQDSPNFYRGRGIPVKFSNLKINGEAKNDSYITREDRVLPLHAEEL